MQPIIIRDIATVEGKELRFKMPLFLVPKLDETEEFYWASHDKLGIDAIGQTRKELINDFISEVEFAWSEYAREPDETLTLGAQELKRTLLEMIEEIENPPMFCKTVMVDNVFSPNYGPELRFFEISLSLKAIDAIIAANDFITKYGWLDDHVSLELYGESDVSPFVENSDGEIEDYATCEEWSNSAHATFAITQYWAKPRLDVESYGRYVSEGISISELRAFKAAHTSQGGQNG
jgi:hypothetical protein